MSLEKNTDRMYPIMRVCDLLEFQVNIFLSTTQVVIQVCANHCFPYIVSIVFLALPIFWIAKAVGISFERHFKTILI